VTKSEPTFSVVIPTYNRADKLQRALASLARQSCADFEVLVCDDGSTDHTAAVVASWQGWMDIRHFWESNSGGPARPRNLGIQAARGEWVCFLDADDWWYPHKLAQILPLIQVNDIVYHACDVYTPHGKQLRTKKSRQLTVPAFVDLMIGSNALITSSVCVRRQLLASCGGFDEDRALIAVEDYDLWLRLAAVTERFHFLREPLGAYWMDGDGISGFSERYIGQEQVLIDRYKPRLKDGDQREAEYLLAYKIGIARKHLGQYVECKQYFVQGMQSRQLKIRLYSMFYYLLATLRCPYIIR
jgi:glycosyltransferase involved in cell wall biosynthesis